MLSNGIRVLALADVFDSQNIKNRTFCQEIQPMRGYKIGEFKVFVLPLAHDVPCVGFIIDHPDMGRLFFATDTMMLEYKIPQVDHIMIEANYSDDVLRYNIENGITPSAMKDRLLHSHMELGTLIDIINDNDLTNVQELILLHLSGDNSDEQVFIREVSKNAGKPIYVAKSGMNINLSKTPY
jgi:ribonuclease BN (tRNA processing enzyme)